MSITNTPHEYGSIAKGFHWVIALLVIVMLISGNFMDDIINPSLRAFVYMMHKATGVLIFILMTLRLLWALNNRKPQLPNTVHFIEKILARSTQGVLYLLLFIMPLSGWLFTSVKGYPISFYGLFDFPLAPVLGQAYIGHFWRNAHTLLGWTLLVLISLHALAALKHHFYDKDSLLTSMLPRQKSMVVKMRVKK